MTIVLNERQQRLINPLKERGDWMTAHDLARALGKEALSPEEFMELDHLSDLGLCVKEVAAENAPEGEDLRYRYSEPKVEPGKEQA
jgi:hypothetical protein